VGVLDRVLAGVDLLPLERGFERASDERSWKRRLFNSGLSTRARTFPCSPPPLA
jgi:hypothetical protein